MKAASLVRVSIICTQHVLLVASTSFSLDVQHIHAVTLPNSEVHCRLRMSTVIMAPDLRNIYFVCPWLWPKVIVTLIASLSSVLHFWVDLADLIAPRPEIELATFRSQVWRPATAPEDCNNHILQKIRLSKISKIKRKWRAARLQFFVGFTARRAVKEATSAIKVWRVATFYWRKYTRIVDNLQRRRLDEVLTRCDVTLQHQPVWSI